MKAFRVNLVTSYPYEVPQLLEQVGISRAKALNLELSVNSSGEFDLVIVANYSRFPLLVRCPKDSLVKLIQEPELPGFWFRFTRRSSRHYAEVCGGHEGGFGFLPWHVSMDYESLVSLEPNPKSELISMIASTKRDLEGHRIRDDLANDLKDLIPDLLVYGRGRELSLKRKDDGLSNYKYSIAIENTSRKGYWTEKIMDPILLWTKPVYSGCPDLPDALPASSYISIPYELVRHPIEYATAVRRVISAEPDLESIRLARELILKEYSLGAYIFNSAKKRIESKNREVETRLFLLFEAVSLASLLRDLGFRCLKKLRGSRRASAAN